MENSQPGMDDISMDDVKPADEEGSNISIGLGDYDNDNDDIVVIHSPNPISIGLGDNDLVTHRPLRLNKYINRCVIATIIYSLILFIAYLLTLHQRCDIETVKCSTVDVEIHNDGEYDINGNYIYFINVNYTYLKYEKTYEKTYIRKTIIQDPNTVENIASYYEYYCMVDYCANKPEDGILSPHFDKDKWIDFNSNMEFAFICIVSFSLLICLCMIP